MPDEVAIPVLAYGLGGFLLASVAFFICTGALHLIYGTEKMHKHAQKAKAAHGEHGHPRDAPAQKQESATAGA